MTRNFLDRHRRQQSRPQSTVCRAALQRYICGAVRDAFSWIPLKRN